MGIFSLRTISDGKGNPCMDVLPDVVEISDTMMVDARLMEFEKFNEARLHAWTGKLETGVVKVRGNCMRWLKLEQNTVHKWYQYSQSLIALAEDVLGRTPLDVFINMHVSPCAGFPSQPVDGRQVARNATMEKCPICSCMMPIQCMRRHIGQHKVQGHTVPGEENMKAGGMCGLCGSRKGSSLRKVEGRWQTECSLQPPSVRWNVMGKWSEASQCTNHPINCPACNDGIWTYVIEAHYQESEVHPSSVPVGLMVSAAEKEAVLAWKPCRGGRKGKKRKEREDTRDSDGEADDPEDELCEE